MTIRSIPSRQGFGNGLPAGQVRCKACQRRSVLEEGQLGFCKVQQNFTYNEPAIWFVYLGIVPGHPAENTYCPGCGMTLIDRAGLVLARVNLEDGACPRCEAKLPGRFGGSR